MVYYKNSVIDNEIRKDINKSYRPGYINPEFKPYVKNPNDPNGTPFGFKKLNPNVVIPELVRIDKGLSYRPLYPNDPCPYGFVKDQERGMCMRPPTLQSRNGYSGSNDVRSARGISQRDASNSSTFDMRSTNIYTGNIEQYYLSKGRKSRYQPQEDKYHHQKDTLLW
jgi:hypothetical protein